MNAVERENAHAGTRDWTLRAPADERQVEGFASAASVVRGAPINLYVNVPSRASATLEVFRIGWYAGAGARRVLGPITFDGVAQPAPVLHAATGLAECRWLDPLRVVTKHADGTPWTSGVHLARFTESIDGTQSYAIFVVRDHDVGDGNNVGVSDNVDDNTRTASLLVQLPISTYQAYNNWGGKSLYHWGSGGARASHVSFDRPFALNPAAPRGMGAGEFLSNMQPPPATYGPSNAGWDVNMVRWLERAGVDANYTTSLDTHARGDALRRHAAWWSIGHDEYWTWAMRDHVEAARDAGVHLGFFGANDAYWQVRFEPNAAGVADRVMVCHKKARHDPLHAADPTSRRLTDKWRSGKVARPEDEMLGVMYRGDPVDGDIVIHDARHWALGGTGLAAGDRLPGLLGYEVDGVHDAAKARTLGLEVIAESPWAAMNDASTHGLSHMATHTASSGAVVFAAGTMQWAWGLDDFNAPALRTSRLHPACERIMRNVMARMGVAARGARAG